MNNKAIEHNKEKRRPYRGAKAIDRTCRNHGTCRWCMENRQHKFTMSRLRKEDSAQHCVSIFGRRES